jgi:hypothetical protein
VVDAGLDRRGDIVRSEDGVRVARVRVPDSVRQGHQRYPTVVYRAEVAGRFPPRSLRYVLLAGGKPIAYAIPDPLAGVVRAVTVDRSVLNTTLTVVYGGPVPPPPSTTGGSAARSNTADGSEVVEPAGPYEVERAAYDLGDEVFQPIGLGAKVELVGDVHYPSSSAGGPFPLVVFLHGNHSSCYKGNRSDFRWPCRPGWKPIPSYTGYDYIARRLASYGFIVVSASANGVNVLGSRLGDTGMRQRGEVVEKHIDLWRRWNVRDDGPFGDRFVGMVDLSRIGTMGHSRGGEGVVWNVIVDRKRAHPYGIDAVLALAPVDFTRVTVNEVTLAVVLPYCDGDVYDLQGVHFYDDARYRVPGDPTPKHTVTVFGANHNFFNSVWTPGGGYPGAFDDSFGRCEGKLDKFKERHVGASYIVSYFRRYLGGRLPLDPIWTGARRPSDIGAARVLVNYLPPDTPDRRIDIDRFARPDDTGAGEGGVDVTAEDLSLYGWCGDTFATPCVPGRASGADVHLPGLGQGVIGWSTPHGSIRFSLPPGRRDVRDMDALQFRAASNQGFPSGGIVVQDLSVALVDGSGHGATVGASDVGNAALEYPRRRTGHYILNQVRFPLSRFRGVDLSDVRRVIFRFNRTEQGVLGVADVMFSAGAR